MILVTQSFGRETEYRRVVMAVLSYFVYSENSDAQVLLFTDRPEWFSQYFSCINVDYIKLDSEKIKSMRGAIDFLHRMKISLIEEAFLRYPGHNLLYVDSDTFFTANPDPLMAQVAPNKSFMHLREYKFDALRNMPLPAGESFQAFVRLIESKNFMLADGNSCQVSAQMSSWNAGVMMLHYNHMYLIPDVYALTDEFYPSTKNHASEQYAFSIMLQTKTDLQPCEQVIYHYWHNVKKQIIDEFLPTQFSRLLSINKQSERLDFIKQLTRKMPHYFEHHLLTHKDQAVQKFNTEEYFTGLRYALSALAKGAYKDTVFLKDILYHTKKKVLGS